MKSWIKKIILQGAYVQWQYCKWLTIIWRKVQFVIICQFLCCDFFLFFSYDSETVNQIMMVANTPENWLNFLLKLEKNSVPLNDALLNKLIGRYSQAIEALPSDKYGQNESFARIQVRLAELKA